MRKMIRTAGIPAMEGKSARDICALRSVSNRFFRTWVLVTPKLLDAVVWGFSCLVVETKLTLRDTHTLPIAISAMRRPWSRTRPGELIVSCSPMAQPKLPDNTIVNPICGATNHVIISPRGETRQKMRSHWHSLHFPSQPCVITSIAPPRRKLPLNFISDVYHFLTQRDVHACCHQSSEFGPCLCVAENKAGTPLPPYSPSTPFFLIKSCFAMVVWCM